MKLVITEASHNPAASRSTAYAVSDYRCQMAGPVAIVRSRELAEQIGQKIFGEHACIEPVQADMPIAWGAQYAGYVEARIETHPLPPEPEAA